MKRVLRELAAFPFVVVACLLSWSAYLVVLACFGVLAFSNGAIAAAQWITGEDRS